MAIKYQNNDVYFESTTELLDYVEKTPAAPKWAQNQGDSGRGRSSQDYDHRPSEGWDDNLGYAGAIDFGRNGWAEGVKLLSEQIDLEQGTGITPRRIHDVGGDFPDVGRYLAGRPDCMTRRVIQQGHRRPIITIVMGATFNARIQSKNIINLGAGIAILCDTLENMGFRVAIEVYWRSGSSNAMACTAVQIKKPEQALNLSDLIFFLAHPAALRRIAFASWETMYSGKDWPSGYGAPDAKKTTQTQKEDPCYIHFNNLDNVAGKMRTVHDAVEYVKEQVKNQSPDLMNSQEEQEAA